MALIVVFGVLAVVVKVFDIGGTKTGSDIQITASVTPTPVLDPFIHPESFNIPSSYMGYVVTKVAQADLGKAALEYGKKTIDMAGSEWVIKKSKVSDIEYSQVKPLLDSYIQGQLVKKGWTSKASVNGQKLFPNLPENANISEGYIKVSDSKVQELMLSVNRDVAGNAEIKLFLSTVYNLKDL